MPSIAQPVNIADILLLEVCSGWTKDTVTIAASQTLAIGQVVGQVTASGSFVVLAPAASDGSQLAAGVMLDPISPIASTQKATIIARGAVVDPAKLQWPGGITAGQKTTALAQLKALGIVAAPSTI